MTPDQIGRVAAVGHVLRPDWPHASLVTFLEKHLALKTYGDAVVAMAWIASRTETNTPRLLLEPGAWWKAAVVDDPGRTIRRPPQKHEECATHVGEYRDMCRGCIADRKARTDDEPHGTRAGWDVARVRAEIKGGATEEMRDE